MNGNSRAIFIFVALTALALGAFPHTTQQFESSNELSRLYLATAITDYGSFSITRVIDRWGNITDKSKRDNEYYSDKSPGASLLAIPPALILRAYSFSTGLSFSREQALVFARMIAVIFPCWLFLLYLFSRFDYLSGNKNASMAVVLAYSFATPAWVYSTLLYGHQLAAASLFTAYMILRGNKEVKKLDQVAVGFLLGMAVLFDYPAIWGVACIIVYAVYRGQAKRGLFWLGLAAPVIALAAYHWAAFGSPVSTGYGFKAYGHDAAIHAHGILGISLPSATALYGILLSPRRGLFFFAPWLLFAIPGFIRMARMKDARADFVLCLVMVLGHIILIGGFSDWRAGWSYGPRHLMAMLPFLLPPLVIEFSASGRIERLFIAALVGVSIVTTALAVATFPHVPIDLSNPVTDLFIELAKSGDVGPVLGGFGRIAAWAVIGLIVISSIAWFSISIGKNYGAGWTGAMLAAAALAGAIWVYSMSQYPPRQNSLKHFDMAQVYLSLGDYRNAYLEFEPLTLPYEPVDTRLFATFQLWKIAEMMNRPALAVQWRRDYLALLEKRKGRPPARR